MMPAFFHNLRRAIAMLIAVALLSLSTDFGMLSAHANASQTAGCHETTAAFTDADVALKVVDQQPASRKQSDMQRVCGAACALAMPDELPLVQTSTRLASMYGAVASHQLHGHESALKYRPPIV
jgi:hypothetical protein